MNLSSKDIAEFFAAFAVIASLLFVGLQLHLDRKVALADQYFNRGESAKADRRSKLESDAYLQHLEESWALGWRPFYWNEEWLTARQIESGERSVRAVLANVLSLRLDIIGYDNLYYQYKQGLLEEENWHGMRSSLKVTMSEDEFRRTIFEVYARNTIRPVIEEIVKEIEDDRATAMKTR